MSHVTGIVHLGIIFYFDPFQCSYGPFLDKILSRQPSLDLSTNLNETLHNTKQIQYDKAVGLGD